MDIDVEKPKNKRQQMKRRNLKNPGTWAGKTLAERFWEKVEKTDGCWIWRAGTRLGYGAFYVNGSVINAHRWSYEQLVGPIPEGLTLDHLCRNPPCVRPDHLEAVTMRENTMRGVGITAQLAKKTHCKYGHPYEGENLAFDKKGRRRCRTCERQKMRTRRATS